MTDNHTAPGASHDRMFLLALAACCAGPMLAIVVLTSVLGMAIGPAGALTLGVIAALACVALMVQRHHRTSRTGDQP